MENDSNDLENMGTVPDPSLAKATTRLVLEANK